MSTPAISKPDLVSDEVWDAYTELAAQGDHLTPEDRQLLEQIYAVAPELERLKP